MSFGEGVIMTGVASTELNSTAAAPPTIVGERHSSTTTTTAATVSPPTTQGGESNHNNKKKKEGRNVDPRCFTRRHVAIKIAYVGWHFHGFPAQDSTENTVEAYLFKALAQAKLIHDRASCNYSRCGRTDVGVSAFSQVIALSVKSKLSNHPGLLPPLMASNQDSSGPAETSTSTAASPSKSSMETYVPPPTEGELDYCAILNGIMPPMIRAIACTTVPPTFNARYDCTSRTYKYFFSCADLDLDTVNQAASLLVGTHDFRNLCKIDLENAKTFVREIFSAVVEPMGPTSTPDRYNLFCFTIRGSGFLWHMVRCIMAILLMVAQKKEKPSIVSELLDIKSCPRKPSYEMASELPLVLFDCSYPDLTFIHKQDILENVCNTFYAEWNRASMQCSLLRTMLDSLYATPTAPRAGPPRGPPKHTPLHLRPHNHSLEELQQHQHQQQQQITHQSSSSSSASSSTTATATTKGKAKPPVPKRRCVAQKPTPPPSSKATATTNNNVDTTTAVTPPQSTTAPSVTPQSHST
ncbi:tRNA pseudouridylate synthase [Pelomyxa schiedti]|nr:tRNA pseudouridylate synthase [Pelomyxa schiedti]